jgi:hypothetical protein
VTVLKVSQVGAIADLLDTKISGMKNAWRASVGWILLSALTFVARAQTSTEAPLATFKLHLGDAIEGRDGLRFHWAVAPDASLLISMWSPTHQWTILRLNHWETRTPGVESMKISVDLPEFATAAPSDDPLISPDGHYLVLRSPEVNIGENGSDKQKWEAVVSVIDLRTFKVAQSETAIGGLSGGHLFFSKSGALMLHTVSHLGSHLPLAVTVFSLPSLDQLASCDYGSKIYPHQSSAVIEASDSCPAVMQAANLSGIQELGDPDGIDERIRNLAGPGCWYPELAPTGDLVLFRCGKEHFSDPSGDFSITFWHAFKVLSTSDGKIILSLPLRFNDGASSGIFAYKNGRRYLIVRHGSKLLTYQISEGDAIHPENR